MKAMAIRLVETKELVMVLLGHHKDWDSQYLFWQIDECTDPNECEYMDFEMQKEDFGVMWPYPMRRDKEAGFYFCEEVSFTEQCLSVFIDVFDESRNSKDWKPINISLDLAYSSDQLAEDKYDVQLKAALYEKLRRMSPGEFKKLVDQKIWKGKDFDELVAAWPETI